jgi:hypothetical protein
MKRKQKNYTPYKFKTINALHSIVKKREPTADKPTLAERQVSNLLSATASRKLSSLGYQLGINTIFNNGTAWIGPDGTYINIFTNNAGEDLILIIWGPDAFWVNTDQPLVTINLPPSLS